MANYLYALIDDPAPQPIPNGFDDHYDWDAVDDAEKARRGWVVAQAPAFDPDFERIAVTFAKDETEAYVASYSIVPGDVARARAAARSIVENRRWMAEVGGTAFNGMPLATDRETQGKITSAYLKASADPTFTVESWKFAPGVFVTLDNATIIALGDAITVHVQACFTREAAISALLDAAKDAPAVRAVLGAEIDKAWPGQG